LRLIPEDIWIFWNVKFHAIFAEHRYTVWISGSQKQYLQSDGLASVIFLFLVDAISITKQLIKLALISAM
jgi:hypothetical protein